MSKLVVVDGDTYVSSLTDGDRVYWVSVFTDPATIHPSFGLEVQAASDYVTAPDEKSAKAKFLRRASTKAAIKANAPEGAKVARVNADDRTTFICEHCGGLNARACDY